MGGMNGPRPLRVEAAFRLGELGPRERAAAPALARAHQDSDAPVRRAAERALRKVDPDGTARTDESED
jgi:HEAT repeat protein